ncbi:MAG: YceI family protein [bacterium]|nr:YceI family protein [bacterium]
MHRLTALIVFAALALSLPAFGTERALDLEPESTQVTFTLEAIGHDVAGTLYLHDGRVRFDPQTGAASGEVSIDARRAETGHKKRDKKMHEKVLESEHNPLIVFTPERLEGEIVAEGTSEVELHGTVTLLGAEHPLTLPTTVEMAGDSVTARTTFTVPYVEWGLHDPSIVFLRVAKEVEVTISAAGTLVTVAPAAGDVSATTDR